MRNKQQNRIHAFANINNHNRRRSEHGLCVTPYYMIKYIKHCFDDHQGYQLNFFQPTNADLQGKMTGSDSQGRGSVSQVDLATIN